MEDNGDMLDATELLDRVYPLSSLPRTLLGFNNVTIREAVKQCDLLIARIPSFAAYKAFHFAQRYGKKTLSAAIACAWDSSWNHSLFGKLISPYLTLGMKNVAGKTDYMIYVTSSFLQKRYPCRCESIGVSDVNIQNALKELTEERKQRYSDWNREIVLATTGAVDNPTKGHQYVIRAIPLLEKENIRVKYKLIGGGNRTRLTAIAKKAGVSDKIVFTGRLTPEQVMEELDRTDIYIQPSLQEGLPRAVVEALSRGCLAIGARTGGIPELIDDPWTFEPKSEKEAAQTILRLIQEKNPEQMAECNLEKAKMFEKDRLQVLRDQYFQKIISSFFFGTAGTLLNDKDRF